MDILLGIKNLIEWFSGKKTYIAGGITVIVVALFIFGVIDSKMYAELAGLLGAIGLWALRMAVK